MTRLPRPSGSDLLRALRNAGFHVQRIRGSHHFLQHPDGRSAVVPVHAGDIIGPGLLSKILRETELSRDDLIGLL